MSAGPVDKLVYVIVLGALKKQAKQIRIRGDATTFTVHFEIDGILVEEMTPPVMLRDPVFDRITTMAGELGPIDGGARGHIHLVLGDDEREVNLQVDLLRDGDARICEIRPL